MAVVINEVTQVCSVDDAEMANIADNFDLGLIEAKVTVTVMVNLPFARILRQVAATAIVGRNSRVLKIRPSALAFW